MQGLRTLASAEDWERYESLPAIFCDGSYFCLCRLRNQQDTAIGFNIE